MITAKLAVVRPDAPSRAALAGPPVSGTFEQRRRGVGILFVTPALLILAAILGYPILRSLILAMQHVRLASGHMHVHWIGWDNYTDLISDGTYAKILTANNVSPSLNGVTSVHLNWATNGFS